MVIQGDGQPGSLNHLGIEVDSSDVEDEVVCCYALQDKVWVIDPDGPRWEIYTVLEDAASMGTCAAPGQAPPRAGGCCESEPEPRLAEAT